MGKVITQDPPAELDPDIDEAYGGGEDEPREGRDDDLAAFWEDYQAVNRSWGL